MKTDVLVIGGGPAGLMCAATAAKRGKKVILIDKNNILARKLRITGKGRCNITNSADISEFIGMVCSNPNFMYSAFYTFTVALLYILEWGIKVIILPAVQLIFLKK